jgi:hypothetical protein
MAEELAMKIVQLPKNLALDPDELQLLVAAYDSALSKFQIPDRVLRLKKQLAVAIFDIARLGERNSEVISQQAILRLIQLRNVQLSERQPSKRIVEGVIGAHLRYSGC